MTSHRAGQADAIIELRDIVRKLIVQFEYSAELPSDCAKEIVQAVLGFDRLQEAMSERPCFGSNAE